MASPQVALGYVLLAVICYVVGMREGGAAPVGAMSASDEKR
jgi:hypothetical protein